MDLYVREDIKCCDIKDKHEKLQMGMKFLNRVEFDRLININKMVLETKELVLRKLILVIL